MKKFIISTFALLMTASAAFAAGVDVPMFPIGNEIGNMQNTNSQLRLMRQQHFRQEEYNEFKDNIKETKDERNRQYQIYQEEKSKLYSPNQNLDFVHENGHLMLKSVE